MGEVLILIELPEEDIEVLEQMKKKGYASRHEMAILDAVHKGNVISEEQGKILPRGHGRLIDADKLFIDERKCFSKFPDSISVSYARIFSEIDNAPTILEADEE